MKALPSDHKELIDHQKGPIFHQKIRNLFVRLTKNKDGIGVVEFALLVPVLLTLYIGAVELSVALMIDKKVSKASAISSDIISQHETLDKSRLQEMVGVAQSIVAPHDASNLGMLVVGIDIDASGTPKIAWSWDETNTRPLLVGDDIAIPSAYAIPNTFLLKTIVNLDYHLLLLSPKKTGVDWDSSSINLQKEYYLHQREAKQITCTDC